MNKKLLTFLISVTSYGAMATSIIIRPDQIPGHQFGGKSLVEKISVTKKFANAGSLSMWIQPHWDGNDQAFHFFVVAGKVDKHHPYVMLYRFPDGNLRLLWRNGKKRISDISCRPELVHGQNIHLGFTWHCRDGKTDLKLYVDGKMIGKRTAPFSFGENFPTSWVVGDRPLWSAKKSNFPTDMGRVEIHSRVLSIKEMSTLAKQKFVDGLLSVTNYDFVPGSTNQLRGIIESPTENPVLELSFFDEENKVSNMTLKINTDENGRFETEFHIPDDTLIVRLTVKNNQGKSPIWRVEHIEYGSWFPAILPDYWHGTWLVSPEARRHGGHTYFLKKFELDLKSFRGAGFQWVGSNRATVFINGHSLGTSYGWATPTVKKDVFKLLRQGRNTITADAYIPHASATFLCELSLIRSDGTVKPIATDKSWRVSFTPNSAWNQPGFDASQWKFAKLLLRPPQLPYGATPYYNFAHKPKVSLRNAPLVVKANAGTEVTLNIRYSLPDLPVKSPVFLKLMRQEQEFYRIPISVNNKNGEQHFFGKIYIPRNAPSDSYNLRLECRGMSFDRDAGLLQVSAEKKLSALRVEQRYLNGAPVIHINGKPTPLLLYRTAINTRNTTRISQYATGFDQENVRLVELNFSLEQCWNPDGTFNPDVLDIYIPSILYYAPHCYLVAFFNTDPPAWYLRKNPGERFYSSKGPHGLISYASLKWKRDSTALLTKVIEYVKTRPYYNRIAGFGLDGGEDGQFMQWTGRGLKFVGDYSPVMKHYYQNFLAKKYRSIAALNQAWKSQYRDFVEIEIPKLKRRMGSLHEPFLDPVKDLDIIEYNRAFSRCVVETVLGYAKTIKELTHREKLVGCYYGKYFSIAGILQWGEFDIATVLNSPDIDYLIAVDYKMRNPGKPHHVSAPLASYALNKKSFVDEVDIRTFVNYNSSWGGADTLFGVVSLIRKMFIKSWVKGHGNHWYDLHGGMFENKGILHAIGNIQKIAVANSVQQPLKADIAVFADEESFLFTGITRRQLGAAVRQNGNLCRMGALFDRYFLSDLKHRDFPEYKMYVFLNAWALDQDSIAMINSLKRDGKLLVFLYNSGLISGNTKSIENVSRLTGIKMDDTGQMFNGMRIVAGEAPELFPELKSTDYCSVGILSPVAYPVDSDAKLLGNFLKAPEKKPMALKKYPAWSSFYSSVPILPTNLWRGLARLAGCHIYTQDNDAILYVGSELLGLHSGIGGMKHITWPCEATFTDAVTGEVYRSKNRKVKLPINSGETRIFWAKEYKHK